MSIDNNIAERNKATLTELFKNFGPGFDKWFNAYEKALTPDCTWWMQGWPLVMGVEELKHQVHMLHTMMNVHANPILEWRNMEIFDGGKTIIYERRGSFADADGNTITDWDIMGIIKFNDEGKIYSIRDYFDNTGPYDQVKKMMPEEQIRQIHDLGRASHPLKEGSTPDPHFYKKIAEQLSEMQSA